jgi:hypothetical protein
MGELPLQQTKMTLLQSLVAFPATVLFYLFPHTCAVPRLASFVQWLHSNHPDALASGDRYVFREMGIQFDAVIEHEGEEAPPKYPHQFDEKLVAQLVASTTSAAELTTDVALQAIHGARLYSSAFVLATLAINQSAYLFV